MKRSSPLHLRVQLARNGCEARRNYDDRVHGQHSCCRTWSKGANAHRRSACTGHRDHLRAKERVEVKVSKVETITAQCHKRARRGATTSSRFAQRGNNRAYAGTRLCAAGRGRRASSDVQEQAHTVACSAHPKASPSKLNSFSCEA